MKILFYWKKGHREEKRFKKTVESLVPYENKDIYHNIAGLTERLTQLLYSDIIVIVLTADKEDHANISSICHLLQNSRLILILPDLDEATISKGFELYPRFVSYIDSDFSDVGAVLDKMSGKNLVHEKK